MHALVMMLSKKLIHPVDTFLMTSNLGTVSTVLLNAFGHLVEFVLNTFFHQITSNICFYF